MSRSLRRWHLPLIVLLAALLRLWRLAAKPLWVDELYTTFYSLGKSFDEIPLNTLLPSSDYWSLLASPGTPGQAAQAVTVYSNHPPLFFMAMNRWLASVGTSVWSLRAFAVLWGVVAVVGMFYLGRQVAGPQVGKLAALLLAVSPYGIYLSQEARHYSLAVAIAIFSLIQWTALLQGKRSPGRWLSWIILNGLGPYIHYFYAFCIIAQWLVALGYLLRQRRPAWLLAMVATGLLYIPLLPTAITHFQGDSGTSWLSQSTPLWQTVILPWVQSLVAGVFMLVLLPVEQVPLGVTIPSALIMLGVFGVVLRQFIKGAAKEPLLSMGSPLVLYGAVVFGVMLGITYGLGKDLTLAPRYFFMLYPAIPLLLALGLRHCKPWVWGVAIAAGLVSQLLIAQDIALLKPYLPGQVGRRLAAADKPTVVLVAPQQASYRARALSYILAIPADSSVAQVAFTEPARTELWQPVLNNSDALPTGEVALWLVEPRRSEPFPKNVVLPRHHCGLQGDRIKTEGTRQQLYQCRGVADRKD
ncbi:MAG: glycosyltransferase family 39 protein [Cyanobacteria bacterium P01_D01_bin.156]